MRRVRHRYMRIATAIGHYAKPAGMSLALVLVGWSLHVPTTHDAMWPPAINTASVALPAPLTFTPIMKAHIGLLEGRLCRAHALRQIDPMTYIPRCGRLTSKGIVIPVDFSGDK
jgi:hypothetical protein